jgi:hypothetical protein
LFGGRYKGVAGDLSDEGRADFQLLALDQLVQVTTIRTAAAQVIRREPAPWTR